MTAAYSDIARLLGGARRRQGWVVLTTALSLGVAGALLALLAGAILLGAGAGPHALVRRCAVWIACSALAASLAWAGWAFVRRASTLLAVARRVGACAPELRSDLISSVELAGERAELLRSGRYSVALVDAHIVATAGRVGALDLGRVVPSAPARRSAAVLAAVALVALGSFAAARQVRTGWQRLAGAVPPGAERRAEPITGDVELTYRYPAYMKREPRTLSGTGGEVSAPKGTEVRLITRADRVVDGAEIVIEAAPAAGEAGASGAPRPPRVQRLEVRNGRELTGEFLVEEPGAYRFRYTKGRKRVAEGPPLPIAIEPDAFPEVRITAPGPELEVEAGASPRVAWSASDDVGLGDLTLVVKPPEGEERRTALRSLGGARREAGELALELAPYRLAEGEQLRYRLEATDGDTISGPKRASSATQVLKVHSELERRRAALAKAQTRWEELVGLLGDRLELLGGRPDWTLERAVRAQALDARLKALHEGLRATAQEYRKERDVPRNLSSALANVAAELRELEPPITALRANLARLLRYRQEGDAALLARVAELDAGLDRTLEKDVLYLEQLLDKGRADDLVRVARDLAARRRDLAELLDRYRKAPTPEGKKELLAEVARMKARMREVMRRMSELAKGITDEHMNREALAELARSTDALAGLDEVERRLAAGDIEGAMGALDQLGNAMQGMLSSLERTAGHPGRQNAELMKDVLAFKRQLEQVQGRQEELARRTEEVRGSYRRALGERLRQLEAGTRGLAELAAEARRELAGAERGVTLRSEDDYAQSRDRLADLEKALAARDLDAALETVRRALPPMQRLALGLRDDAAIAERFRVLENKDPEDLAQAQAHAARALEPARRVRDALEQMFPDPRSVLGARDQERLGELAREQGELARKGGELRQRLDELARRAPVFPPQASELLGGSQEHMRRAQGELSQRNPQRGNGEQRQALDELARFRRGLDEVARSQQGEGGFPFPFGEEGSGGEGQGLEPSQEKVEIPGAAAYRASDEFRRDLLEAMKQGSPAAYRSEVQRYYEELVR